LTQGLRVGFKQNTVLRTEFNDKSIIEYLLTVNFAQQLIEYNQNNNGWGYAINLGKYYDTNLTKNLISNR